MKTKPNNAPPTLARTLLARRLGSRRDEVLDDLDELFRTHVAAYGLRKARRLYVLNALNMVLLGIGERAYTSISFPSVMMYGNYVRVAVRALRKHRAFAAINVLGLAVGIAASLLILQYVTHELSYDNVSDADRIYRVENNYIRGGQLIYESAATFPGVGPALREHVPEVETVARLFHSGFEHQLVVTYDDAPGEPLAFAEEHLLFADPSFLDLFDVHVLRGDPATALSEAGRVMLSAATARRYFGEANPIGKVLRYTNNHLEEYLLTVTGVFADEVRPMHVRYELLVSYKTLHLNPRGPEHYEEQWGDYHFYTYVRLRPGVDPGAIEARMPTLVDQYKPDYMEVDENGRRIRVNEFRLAPLRDIHLYSNYQNEVALNGNGTLVYFLLIIALFILLIAWVNYINLSTARAVDRAKEVGIRKVLGSRRAQIMRQFLFESLLMNLLAVAMALVLVVVAQPYFNRLTDKALSLAQWTDPLGWLGMAAVFLVGTLLAGLYPALVLSSFRPVTVLKGAFRHHGRGILLRKGLVVFQFTASIALMVGTFTVYRQLDFMMDRDLGFELGSTLIIEQPGLLAPETTARQQHIETFKALAEEVPGVRAVVASSIIPGRGIHRGIVVARERGADETDIRSIEPVTVDYDFLDAYGFTFLAGRNFSRSVDDATAMVLNEAAARFLGFDPPSAAVGETVYEFGEQPREVIGLIADYHHESLRRGHDPMYFRVNPYINAYYSVKIDPGNLEERLEGIQQAYAAAFPGNPFSFYFLEDLFDRQYGADRRFGGLFRFFAGLAIFVACLGLYGLAAFTTLQRTKEIGVRKVLGATHTDILLLISQDFARLVLLAAVAALPLAYAGLDRWLAGYAFHIELAWWLFALPMLLVTLLALLTVGGQALKAAIANPVESIRLE